MTLGKLQLLVTLNKATVVTRGSRFSPFHILKPRETVHRQSIFTDCTVYTRDRRFLSIEDRPVATVAFGSTVYNFSKRSFYISSRFSQI